MGGIVIEDDGVSVDAEVLGEAFGLAPAQVPALMREGAITSLFERGEGEDAGRMRLSFFHGAGGFGSFWTKAARSCSARRWISARRLSRPPCGDRDERRLISPSSCPAGA
jgi:hypothetical protein